MISLIDFEKDLIIPIEEAKELGLRYDDQKRFGIKNNKLYIMHSYNHYYDECIEKDGKYYLTEEDIAKNKHQEKYYLYEHYKGNINYVYVKKENHLVSLLEFAPKCKHKFFVHETVDTNDLSINNIKPILRELEEKIIRLGTVVNACAEILQQEVHKNE